MSEPVEQNIEPGGGLAHEPEPEEGQEEQEPTTFDRQFNLTLKLAGEPGGGGYSEAEDGWEDGETEEISLASGILPQKRGTNGVGVVEAAEILIRALVTIGELGADLEGRRYSEHMPNFLRQVSLALLKLDYGQEDDARQIRKSRE